MHYQTTLFDKPLIIEYAIIGKRHRAYADNAPEYPRVLLINVFLNGYDILDLLDDRVCTTIEREILFHLEFNSSI